MAAKRAIAHYALYGEAVCVPDPEFVHIEDIGARSRLHEWHIRPHVHRGMVQLLILARGRARACLDEDTRDIRGPCAVLVPGGVVHGFEFEPDAQGHVVTAGEDLFSAAGRGSGRPFAELPLRPAVIDFDGSQENFERIQAMLGQLEREFQWPQQGRSAMLEWLLHGLLMLVWRQLDLQQARSQVPDPRHQTFTRFRRLLEEHFAEHWTLVDYARSLAVAPSTLNRICRQFAGRAALRLVQERLMVAARRDLVYTDASVEAIAYGLGFQDPAYFSRFFKRHTAQAPGRFRQSRQPTA